MVLPVRRMWPRFDVDLDSRGVSPGAPAIRIRPRIPPAKPTIPVPVERYRRGAVVPFIERDVQLADGVGRCATPSRMDFAGRPWAARRRSSGEFA